MSKTTSPPFNSQILGIAQKFARGLGPDVMLVLERLHMVGARSESSRGLVQSYEGVRVDGGGGAYQHLSQSGRSAHEQLIAVMERMPPELWQLAKELVLEDVGMELNSARGAPPRRARTAKEIGQELTGYDTEQRALGAVIGALRIIAWIARGELGFTRRKP